MRWKPEGRVWVCREEPEIDEEMENKCVYICVLTCSIVSGEQISSPLRIIERWVSTSDSWKASRPSSSLALVTTERCTEMCYTSATQLSKFDFFLTHCTWAVNRPCLVVIWAPPAVMNSMFPSCKTPDSSLNMSLISSSVNSNTFSASYKQKNTGKEITNRSRCRWFCICAPTYTNVWWMLFGVSALKTFLWGGAALETEIISTSRCPNAQIPPPFFFFLQENTPQKTFENLRRSADFGDILETLFLSVQLYFMFFAGCNNPLRVWN